MAGEAPDWAIPIAASALQEATDRGREVGVAEVQAAIGAGHEDTLAVLDVLRVRGEAVEDSPGMWRCLYADEARDAAEPPEPPPEVAEALEREDAQRGTARARSGHGGTVETRLTAGMLTHLDAQAIGALVQAGVQDAGDRPFVLRIEP